MQLLQRSRLLLLPLLLLAVLASAEPLRTDDTFPPPFNRPLSLGAKSQGADVHKLNFFLQRSFPDLGIDVSNKLFDELTESGVKMFQKQARLESTGMVDATTATAIADRMILDPWRNIATPAAKYGRLFKVLGARGAWMRRRDRQKGPCPPVSPSVCLHAYCCWGSSS